MGPVEDQHSQWWGWRSGLDFGLGVLNRRKQRSRRSGLDFFWRRIFGTLPNGFRKTSLEGDGLVGPVEDQRSLGWGWRSGLEVGVGLRTWSFEQKEAKVAKVGVGFFLATNLWDFAKWL